jgi:hypothetical protein
MAADLAFHFSAAVRRKEVPQSGWGLEAIRALKILTAKVAKKGREVREDLESIKTGHGAKVGRTIFA